MTKSKLERLVDYATELCGELDAPGYLTQALGASILGLKKDYTYTAEAAYECIYDMLKIVDNDNQHMSIEILAGLIGRIIYQSNLPIQEVQQYFCNAVVFSVRGAFKKKVMDNV